MKKGLILTTTLAMALGVGVAVGAHRAEAKVAKAYGNDDAYWFVAGSFNEWNLQDTHTHLTYSKDVGNNWEYESEEYIQFEEGDEFKFVYSWGGTPETTNYLTPNLMTNSTDFTGGSGSNFVASKDIKVKFFLQVYGSEGTWMGVYWEEYEEPAADPVFTISNRGFAQEEFELDEDDKPEGVVHQYSVEVQYAKRGGTLQFYKDGVEITEHIGPDAGDEENINNVYQGTNGKFYLRSTYSYSGKTKIYLKTYSDGGYSVWGEGYNQNVFYSAVRHTESQVSQVTLSLDTTFQPNETYIAQYKTSSAVVMKALSGAGEQTSNNMSSNGGLSEDVTPEAGPTNNARQAYQASAWKVHNDCEEVIYLKEKKEDLSLVLYVGGYQEAHVITIGGNEVPLTKVDDTQYKATGVDLSAGDTVTGYTIEGESHAVTSRAVANNNLTKDMKVLVDVEDADIYFGVSDSTIYISGLPLGGYHILKNGRTFIEMNPTDPYEEYVQYCSIKLSFAVNDTIQFIDCTGNNPEAEGRPSVWTISKINEGGLGDHFEYDSESGVIKCKTACETAVYMKLKSGLDEIYFGEVAEWVEEVLDFVAGFKTAMQESCSAEASGKKAAVEAAWGAQATAFGKLSDEAKAEIKLGGSSSLDEVKEFAERYSGILSQHYDWDLDNFLNWDVAPARNIGSYELTSDNAALIIIVTVASLSVLAFATLLILKKRKHN